MNNRALVNLKQIMPATGQAIVTSNTIIRPDILKPLGWHSFNRVKVAKLVLQVKQTEAGTYWHTDKWLNHKVCLDAIRAAFKSRHNPPKGWKA